MWNVEPSGKFRNHEVVSRNGILHVMSDRINVNWME